MSQHKVNKNSNQFQNNLNEPQNVSEKTEATWHYVDATTSALSDKNPESRNRNTINQVYILAGNSLCQTNMLKPSDA